MTATYSGNPAASPIDAVRFWINDTDVPTNALLQNEEIQYVITLLTPSNGGDPLFVAAWCCQVIAGKYAGEISITADGVSYSGDQLQDKYLKLAQSLRDQYNQFRGLGGAPYAGGILEGEFTAPGTKSPEFGIGKDDNLRAGGQRFGLQGDFIPGDEGTFGDGEFY